MRLALFQPDIPQNAGAALRLAACLGVGVDIIEPCGFVWSEPKMRRAGMDYIDAIDFERHSSWDAFQKWRRSKGQNIEHDTKNDQADSPGRLVLLTTAAAERLDVFQFQASDTILMGRESVGAPEDVHKAADARIRIPMAEGMRSLNVVNAAAIALAEGLRQTKGFPE